ncbi:alpha/beta hydrolase [Marinobacter sp. ATCH36]|nr:alpha/beta family hydrolase [Marinobacter sp. ATCH36]MCL7945820.1 alpha/beta hydrolase [Marinobacter sp. ATCH36]
MEKLASALSEEGVATVRFEFAYMKKRRQDGRKRPPDRQPVLLDHFREAISACLAETVEGGRFFIGGKSMGGRMASHVVAQMGTQSAICGAVCFGYPFHPPGKPERWRTSHFQDLQRPVKIIQGTRDPFGKKQEVEAQRLGSADNVCVSWLDGGDHDYRPLARQPETHDEMISQAASVAAAFIHQWE